MFVCLWGGAGVILLLILRGEDRVDPMSPDYAGNKDLDEWGEALKKEEERRIIHPGPADSRTDRDRAD